MVYGLLRDLPGESGLLVTVAPKKLASRELDAGVEASGPHDLAVRFPQPSSQARSAATATRAAFVTTAKRPFWWRGMVMFID